MNNRVKGLKKAYLRSGVGMVALVAGVIAGQAFAQDTTAAPEATEDVTEVVVTGVRASIAKSIDIKRRSVQIVDSVVAEDIGKLPDNNVVEALQRVTGIQVTNRQGGEISGISIRGMPDIATTWNGRSIFTTTGRSVALQDIPANLINRIDVYKTRSADQLETGIAGQIDVSSHRPFNFKGAQISAAARGTYFEQNGEYNPNVSALFSNRWDTGAGEVGALLNVSYARTKFRNQDIVAGAMLPFVSPDTATLPPSSMPNPCNNPNGWVPLERIFPTDCRAPGQTLWQTGMEHGLPTAPGSTLNINGVDTEYLLTRDALIATDFTGDRERPAVNAAFQWRPNDKSEYTFEYFYEGYRNKMFNRMLFSFVDAWWALPPGTPQSSYTLFPGTNIIKSRTVGATGGFNSSDYTQQKTDTHVYALNGKWYLSDSLTLVGDLAYQTSEFTSDFFAMRTTRDGTTISMDFNAKDGLPSWSFATPSILTDPTQWRVGELYDNSNRDEGDALTASLDGDWEANEGILKKVSFGVRYDDRGATQYFRGQDAWWLGTLLSDFTAGTQEVNSGFFDGKSDVPTSWVLLDGPANYGRADDIRAIYRARGGQGFGHIQTSDQFVMNKDFDVQEVTTSAYFMADLEPQIFNRPLLVNFGLRYVKVDTDMTFTDRQPPNQTNSASASVRRILPSLTLRYDLTDSLRLRYNYGETLRRPNFGDLNPNFTLTGDLSGVGRGSGNRGNPDLKATESKNTDVAVEWYFARDSLVSLTLFKREIEGLVVTAPLLYTIPNDNYNTETFLISQPVNASNGELEGAELGFTYFPDYLPGLLDGLGVQGSVTVLESSQNLPIYDSGTGQLVGQDTTSFFGVSDFSYNVTMAYERGPIGARLSYVWREDFMDRNEARLFANPLGIWRRPEKSLDFQVNYNVTDKLSISLDAINITDELSQSYYKFGSSGGPDTHNFGNTLLGRQIAVGLRWRLN
ncbi:TonB-dependent receptor [Asticcacaulis sp. ZE23SCel15]|uniref:TonB-dependent receptor n=1 Tax=Asticcacaulis sp. ZE23SCel15 TaxID=3059027 RepID=UPI00265FC204|nr:TonB-dependent receptor [Asticcacaulis sp. ZE23SCel15]WKL57631.1 TonB-dependent receptor [Asticcacaulis sp. ZE23SCel15]